MLLKRVLRLFIRMKSLVSQAGELKNISFRSSGTGNVPCLANGM